ncbi:hypothetical protein BU17DRAFT_94272 [Hysterangium stoloniferum]|nr:hypothetical protein BU17DRAFT_94272 [Hysterangium stoloniferum]
MNTDYEGFIHKSGKITLLYRGPWAGDRFAFWDTSQAKLDGYEDVSDEVCKELRAVWASEYRSQPSATRKELSNKNKKSDLYDELGQQVEGVKFKFNRSQAVKEVPFEKPPPEIISIILHFAMGLRERGRSRSSTLVTCTHVYQTWRNLAIRDPGLWCLLESGDLTSQTETFLARSQSTDRKMYLDIMVEDAHYDSHNGTPESKLEKFISLVRPHSSRWARFTYLGESETFDVVLAKELDFSHHLTLINDTTDQFVIPDYLSEGRDRQQAELIRTFFMSIPKLNTLVLGGKLASGHILCELSNHLSITCELYSPHIHFEEERRFSRYEKPSNILLPELHTLKVSKISHCAINRLIQEREKLGASSLKQLHVAGVFRGLCDYFADRISSTEPLIIKTWEEYSAEMMAPDQEMECETGSESV